MTTDKVTEVYSSSPGQARFPFLARLRSRGMQFRAWSYRFADQVLNSQLALKNEVEEIIHEIELPIDVYKRTELNARFLEKFTAKGWQSQPRLFVEEDVDEDAEVPLPKIDFLEGDE